MMGKQHVAFGVVCSLGAGAVVAQFTGSVWLGDVLIATAQAGGYALVPDLDQRVSLATKSFPAFTKPMHYFLVWMHRLVYAATRRAHDPPSTAGGKPRPRVKRFLGSPRLALVLFGARRPYRSAHRGLSHSLIFAVFLAICAGLAAWSHPAFAVAIILFGVLVADKLVFAIPITLAYGISSLIYFTPYGALEHFTDMAPLWGLAVLIGLASHDLGDSCTKMGAALLAPYTWKMYRAPMNFGTNGPFERYVLRWLFVIMTIYFMGVIVSAQWPGLIPGILRIFFRAGG